MRPRPDCHPSRHPTGETRRSRRRVSYRLGLEALERRIVLSPTIYTVNSTENGTAGSGASGTLPYVISVANTDPNPDGSEIEFDPTVFSAPQTIQVTDTLDLHEFPGPLVIDGPGAGLLTVRGPGDQYVFSNEQTATLSGLTITGGGIDYASRPGPSGGGIGNTGFLTLTDCTISGNNGVQGGGIYNAYQATIVGCTISGNTAVAGAGLFDDYQIGRTATLTDCTISGNYASADGGGVGAPGSVTLTDCTISGNTAGGDGGGIANENVGSVNIIGCTISGNTASKVGGGLYDIHQSITTLTDTIVAGNNLSNGGASDISTTSFGGGASGTYNLIGPGGSGGIPGGTDGNIVLTSLEGLDLGPLANNGGSTQTMALLPGGAAVGAGTVVNGVTTDQRGLPLDAPPDIGAYQVQAGTLAVASISPVSPAIRNTPVDSVMVTLNRRAGSTGFGTNALTLTDDGGPNLINGDVTVTLVSGANYLIGGLSGLTTAQGTYTLTVNTADIVDAGGNAGAGSQSISWQKDAVPSVPAVVVGQQPVFERKLNKKGRPVGKAVLTGFTLEFGTPLDATAANDAANLRVDTSVIRKAGKKVEHILHPIGGIRVSYDAAGDAVTIALGKPQKFPTGGQVTVLVGLTSASGGPLIGTTVFTISRGGKGIVPG